MVSSITTPGTISTVQHLESGASSAKTTALTVAEAPLPDPEPALMGDDAIFEIAALLAESACDDRKHARTMRNAGEKSIERQVALRVENMRDAAEDRRMAAMVSGGTGILAGSAGAAGGLFGVTAKTHNEAWTALGGGASTGTQGAGTLLSSSWTHDAELADARAVTHEAAASRAERTVDECTDDMANARAFMDKVMEFLKEVRSGQNASAQAASMRG